VFGDRYFLQSGHIFRRLLNGQKSILISAMKGGILTIYDSKQTIFSDYGWVVKSGKKQFVNHWWSNKWVLNQKEESIEIAGHLFPHREKISTPFLHFGLRMVSFFFGRSLTRLLRKVLIFKSKASGLTFSRKIEFGPETITITDRMEGLDRKANVSRAPRASKRHVASADSWHEEDWMGRIGRIGKSLEERVERGDSVMVIITSIGIKD
jgi:hypothetical protein